MFDSVSTDGRTINNGTLVSSNNRAMFDTNGDPVTIRPQRRYSMCGPMEMVKPTLTSSLGLTGNRMLLLVAVGQTKSVSAYAGETLSGNQLVEPSSQISRALGRAGEYELRVKAEDEDGEALPNAYVEFRTSDGELEDPGEGTTNTLGQLGVETDTRSMASAGLFRSEGQFRFSESDCTSFGSW